MTDGHTHTLVNGGCFIISPLGPTFRGEITKYFAQYPFEDKLPRRRSQGQGQRSHGGQTIITRPLRKHPCQV